jgi:metal transporter CNNM
MPLLTWLGIAACLSQSAMFSGLNLALFGVSWLQLEVQADTGNRDAAKLLSLRKDSNFLLTTILWGNVGANVLLTILSDSVLTGLGAFILSTFVITCGGEIAPQAYFSRHALRMAGLLAPALRFYQFLLYPLARPTALLLDRWLGPHGIEYFREQEMREVLRKHIASKTSDVDLVEGIGALNFLALDDLAVAQEGEAVDPLSIIDLPLRAGQPVFPEIGRSPDDPFLRRVEASGLRWVIVTTPDGDPQLALDSDAFLRAALFGRDRFNPYAHCHRPIVVRDTSTPLGDVLTRLKVHPESAHDDVIDDDIILVWGEDKRVITGADILGRLMRGIAKEEVRLTTGSFPVRRGP